MDLPQHERQSGPYPVVGSNGIAGYHTEAAAKGPGVTVGRSGSVGKVTWIETDYWPLNTSLWVTDFHGNAPEFIFHFLTHLDLAKHTAGVSVPTLNRNVLHPLEVIVPPLPEQRAIARALRAGQQAKKARRREAALERERKAALMEHLFTHGTCGESTKQTEIGELPESWRVLPLGELAKIERGKFAFRPTNDPRFYGGSTPFIQTGDVATSNGRIRSYSQSLNEEGLAISKVFPKGTIIITIAANIGFAAILEFDCACTDSLIGITPNGEVDNEYLNYYLATQQHEMDQKAPRGTQKNINIEFLKPWPVKVPCEKEQRSIASILSACDVKIGVLEREVDLLDELFRALLEELMTGRLSAVPLIETAEGGGP
jgi:type I restriction enzyme, S subunit